MKFTEIKPGKQLSPYINCYWILESESDLEIHDTIFPAGYIEIVFNLGEALWQSSVDNLFRKSPAIELLGQITRPMPIKACGKNKMLGIRFFSHSAAYFFNEEAWHFNDQISNLADVFGATVRILHERLINTDGSNKQIGLIEDFLLRRIRKTGKGSTVSLVRQIVEDMQRNAFSDNIDTTARRYGITPRYLQKLFLQHIGITPKLYGQINRFKLSLRHIGERQMSLTSIAYDCGYSDQSHFIREFKSFAGITPSAYIPDYYPVSSSVRL